MSTNTRNCEVHVIQCYGAGNLNRDEAGDPKTCTFGDVQRSRISSQCLKAHMRHSGVFMATVATPLAQRSRGHIRQLLPLLTDRDPEEALQVLQAFLPRFLGGGLHEKDHTLMTVALYLSPADIDAIVAALQENWAVLVEEAAVKDDQAKETRKIVKALSKDLKALPAAPDLALFGRMMAADPTLTLPAAAHVSHAISTHAMTTEYDFFTAQDHLVNSAETGEAGAAHMGYAGFVAPTYYRYARLDWNQLLQNLQDDTGLAGKTAEGFLRSFLLTFPSGKQSGFAAYGLPALVLVVIKNNHLALSLANAFERPVRSRRNSGFVGPSVEALDRYWGLVCRRYAAGVAMQVRGLLAVDEETTGPIGLAHLRNCLVEDLETLVGDAVAALIGGVE